MIAGATSKTDGWGQHKDSLQTAQVERHGPQVKSPSLTQLTVCLTVRERDLFNKSPACGSKGGNTATTDASDTDTAPPELSQAAMLWSSVSKRHSVAMSQGDKLEYWELSANFKKKSPHSPHFTGSDWKGLSQGREHSKYYFTFYLHRIRREQLTCTSWTGATEHWEGEALVSSLQQIGIHYLSDLSFPRTGQKHETAKLYGCTKQTNTLLSNFSVIAVYFCLWTIK